MKESILLNSSFTFSGLQKSLWKRVSSDKESNSLASRVGDEVYWYVGGDECRVTKNSTEQSLAEDNPNFGGHLMSRLQSSINGKDITQPSSAYLRGLYSSQELFLEGVVITLNTMGWIEITLTLPLLSENNNRSMNVFVVHYRRSDIIDKLQKGVAVRISYVFPIYLWGQLHGFAATVRSHIEILEEKSFSKQEIRCGTGSTTSISIDMSRSNCAYTNRKRLHDHILTDCDSSSKSSVCSTSDDNSVKNSASVNRINKIGSNSNINSLDVPSDMKGRCHMYAAWRAYIHQKYIASTSLYPPQHSGTGVHKSSCSSGNSNDSISSSSSSSSNHGYGHIRGDRRALNGSSSFSLTAIPIDILRDIEEWALIGSDSNCKNGCVSQNDNSDGLSNNSSIDCISNSTISSTTNYTKSSICTSRDTDGRTKSDHLSTNVTSLAQSCLLPAGRSVQEEFMSGTYTELFSVR